MKTWREVCRCGIAVALCGCALLAGCVTTPERPPPPAPRDIPEAEPRDIPQPPPLPDPQAGPVPPAPTSAPSAGAPEENFAAPSADAAEVEMEEVAVDGSAPRAERPQSEVLAEMHEAGASGDAAANAGGGGGGAPMPVMVEDGGTPVEGAAPNSANRVGTAMARDPDLAAPGIQIGAETSAEQVAALDRRLDRQLAEFEELMGRARAAAAEERAQQGGGAPSGELDGRGQRLAEPPDMRGAGGAAASGSGLGNTPDLVGERAGIAPQAALAATPSDLPDGRDDDIVARQLREAASKERDPVLREKLWAEYRKYKAAL